MIVQIVRWKSGLTEAEVLALFEARAAHYREVPGLVQKYYLRYESGEFGAVYLWESAEALETFRASEVGRGMAGVFAIEGQKAVHLADVVLALHPGRVV
ncbi:MAG: monooxygenase [Vicinamibacteraceae bacterium]|nr:monooxygenase [Vicinamibacteraceae bacterium]